MLFLSGLLAEPAIPPALQSGCSQPQLLATPALGAAPLLVLPEKNIYCWIRLCLI